MEENKMDNEQIKKLIKEQISLYLKGQAFTDRKLTDTPTDSFSVVNRRYVTLNGTLANRPLSSVATIGQTYLATDTGIPMTKVAGGWANGVGSIVALNN